VLSNQDTFVSPVKLDHNIVLPAAFFYFFFDYLRHYTPILALSSRDSTENKISQKEIILQNFLGAIHMFDNGLECKNTDSIIAYLDTQVHFEDIDFYRFFSTMLPLKITPPYNTFTSSTAL
jgi:hypothetical protein